MAATRDELRDHLMAVVAAAPELSRDDREHLADVFLDRLDADFQLVPRGRGAVEPVRPSRPSGGFPPFSPTRAWPMLMGIGAMILLIPLLVMSLFVFTHPPFFLFAILVFLVLRSFVWGPRRRQYM